MHCIVLQRVPAKHVAPCCLIVSFQVGLIAERQAAGDARPWFPTPEDVRKIEGIIVCRHTREPTATS
jgi:hypothetical protein